MGRPKSQNPKNRHIGIVTTESKFRRYKMLGLRGDEAIDVLLYYLEKDNVELNVKKSMIVTRIKNIAKEIEELEFEKIKLETQLEQVNEEIGVNKSNGLNKQVDSAVKTVLQRFNKQSVYNIYEFIDYNKEFIENQAYLCNVSFDEFKGLLHEYI